jgi:hypothetical protein
MIVAGVSVMAALAIAPVIVLGGRSEVKTSTGAPPARDAAAASPSSAPTNPSPPLIAPIIIAPPPPDPVDDSPVAPPPPPPTGRGASPLERARSAALSGRSAEVRALLESKVRTGHGTPEEIRLVKGACQAMSDTACLDDIRARPR